MNRCLSVGFGYICKSNSNSLSNKFKPEHSVSLLAKIEAEKAGIVQKRSALEQEKYEDTLIRRRQEYQPCIYAQTVGRGSCYRHCVECFAVDGICDAHLDRHDHVAEMLNKFDDAEK